MQTPPKRRIKTKNHATIFFIFILSQDEYYIYYEYFNNEIEFY